MLSKARQPALLIVIVRPADKTTQFSPRPSVATGISVKEIALYEPPYIAGDNGPRSFEDAKSRLQSLSSAGDRGGAMRVFMTDVHGAPGDAIPDAERIAAEFCGLVCSALSRVQYGRIEGRQWRRWPSSANLLDLSLEIFNHN